MSEREKPLDGAGEVPRPAWQQTDLEGDEMGGTSHGGTMADRGVDVRDSAARLEPDYSKVDPRFKDKVEEIAGESDLV